MLYNSARSSWCVYESHRLDFINSSWGNRGNINIADYIRLKTLLYSIWIDVSDFSQFLYLPPLRRQPQLRLHHLHALMPRKAEVDEPLAVDRLGHFFQNFDAASVVLDQVVVGGEDGSDFALGGKGWKRNRNKVEALDGNCVKNSTISL